MSADLRAIRSWKTWRAPITADDATADFTTMGGAGPAGAVIAVYPYSAILIMVLGKNSNNDTAIINIIGRMDDQTKSGSGPSQALWKGQVILTTKSDGTAASPLNDNKWGAGSTWFWTDTFDIAGAASGHNSANAVIIGGTTAGDATLLLPTLGYTNLEMHITDVGGGGTEMTEVGVLYREIAMGGVV